MKVILFTNARDEKHIKEWVAHHLNLGFDFIHIFDHISIIPINDLFKPNDKLKINRLEVKENIKKICIDSSIHIAKRDKYDWMLYLDADEFLILNDYDDIKSFIESYNDNLQIGVNWVFFGSNFLTEEPDGMILENYIRCHHGINRHLKSFVKIESIISSINAHVYHVNKPNTSICCYKSLPFNKSEPYWKNIPDKNYMDTPAYIAHYINQAYNVYKFRRLSRKRDDNSSYNKIYSENELHNIDNDMINITVRDKYCSKNAELMKTL